MQKDLRGFPAWWRPLPRVEGAEVPREGLTVTCNRVAAEGKAQKYILAQLRERIYSA